MRVFGGGSDLDGGRQAMSVGNAEIQSKEKEDNILHVVKTIR